MANLAGKFKLSYEVMGSDFIQFSNKLKLELLVYGQVSIQVRVVYSAEFKFYPVQYQVSVLE